MAPFGKSSISDAQEELASWYERPPPEFGHKILPLFHFDSQYVNLNHGSFGSMPHPVHAACNVLNAQIEANPDHFTRFLYQPALNATRARISQLIGADTDDCVTVPNVAYGINTILQNYKWNKDDIIVTMNVAYDSVTEAISRLRRIPSPPTISQFTIEFPTSHASILLKFREHIRFIKNTKRDPTGNILAIFDSIVSNPGVMMPWKEMVQICKEEAVYSLVDAAHSIGQEVGINLKQVDPDFWVSSCNKWLYAKRGCAVLYVPKRNQHIITTTVLPALIYPTPGVQNTPFVAQFFWSGSADFVPALSISAAIDFRNYLGGEEKINAYCRSLALRGGKRLAEVMGTSIMDSSENPGELVANMVNVELPLSTKVMPSGEIYQLFQSKLLLDHKIYATHFYHAGKWWTRVCAQIYNEAEDFEKLGKAFIAICKEIEESYKI